MKQIDNAHLQLLSAATEARAILRRAVVSLTDGEQRAIISRAADVLTRGLKARQRRDDVGDSLPWNLTGKAGKP